MSKAIHSNYSSQHSVIIRGDISFTNVSQLFSSGLFQWMISNFIERLEKRNSPLLKVLAPFKKEDGSYDRQRFISFIYLLNLNSLEDILESKYFEIEIDNEEYTRKMENFVESLYNYWRSIQRFMVKQESYSSVEERRRAKAYALTRTNDDFRKLVLDTYRQILSNIKPRDNKVFRELPSGAQASFLADNFEIMSENKLPNESLYKIPYVWQVIFEPPVIFYTRRNTRKGVFPVKEKSILQRFYMDNSQWFVIPIMVGELLEMVYVHKDFLSLGAGLANLYEIASPEVFKNRKPDGYVLFGLDSSILDEDEQRGVVIKENGVHIGVLPNHEEIDYFGYMKKMVLTVHNLIQIERGCLPIHGALAKIQLRNGNCANVMLIGDSGAGKSETLEAINKLPENSTSSVDMLIDDMGSLHIDENGKVVAVGTEIGAFVRLDDLQPGYAYSAMDRSIFMNPNIVNARVIVPMMNYEDITEPTEIDYLFYVNNYDEVNSEEELITFFDDLQEAYDVFAEGKRMAKGTTGEVGISTSYFANPFGAVQMKEVHETIAKKYFDTMYGENIKIGVLKTRLGISGYEQEGPLQAAQALINMIEKL